MNGPPIAASLLPAGSPGSTWAEATLRSCLSRLLVVHCSSSAQLLLTLHLLETSLSSRPSLALLLIDSISAFYWLDRSEGGASFAKQEENLSKCSDLLARLLRYCWPGAPLLAGSHRAASSHLIFSVPSCPGLGYMSMVHSISPMVHCESRVPTVVLINQL